MKKAIFLLTFLFALGFTAANAQCSGGATKACCANKAAKAAASDASIEKRTADDGAVTYVRKEADAQGNVKFVSVQFDEASSAFVNVAPKGMEAADKATCAKKTASCSAAEKKACAAGGEKKACCAGGGSAKACAGQAAPQKQ